MHTRNMQEHDIAAAMRLKTDAGWNQTIDDWLLFLTLHPQGCFVAEHEQQVIGTVTTMRYGQALGWIGMLLVDPAFRRQGIGTRLIAQAIHSLNGCALIGLDATPAGLPLYERLGFKPAAQLVRLTADPLLAQPPPLGKAVAVDAQALPRVMALDQPVFGANRAPLLKALWQRTPDLAWMADSSFCLGRHGTRYTQIGPLFARTSDDALTLCRRVFQHLSGTAVVLDVPERQAAFVAWLQETGFVVQRPLTRMLLETSRLPGILAHQFAIAGPEVG